MLSTSVRAQQTGLGSPVVQVVVAALQDSLLRIMQFRIVSSLILSADALRAPVSSG